MLGIALFSAVLHCDPFPKYKPKPVNFKIFYYLFLQNDDWILEFDKLFDTL